MYTVGYTASKAYVFCATTGIGITKKLLIRIGATVECDDTEVCPLITDLEGHVLPDHRIGGVRGTVLSVPRKLVRYEQHYFRVTEPGVTLISGINLPIDEQGEVCDTHFFECAFHPSCNDVVYRRCIFEGVGSAKFATFRAKKLVRCEVRP